MPKLNYKLLLVVIILSAFGIIMIYSSSYIWANYKFNDPYKYVKAQIIFFFISLLLSLFLSKIDYHFYEKHANLILFICLSLLLLVLIPGIGKIRNGSRSWFGIGSLGIQPSEFAKIGLIIFTSKYLAHNKINTSEKIKNVLPLFLIISLSFGLIMLEPDFGTGMVLTLSIVILIFTSGIELSFFIKLGLIGLLGIVCLIMVAPYRMTRIVSFLNPWSDPLGSGFQIIQSLYAIGPGGLLGQGFLSSRQKQFYLPEPQTDFIFSIISEEFGFLGVLIVTSLFFLLIYYITKIALKQTELFPKYLCFGIGISILIQALLNISVVIGLIPVTGVTLPFLSYGGSSLLVSLAQIGIILNIDKTSK
jgi:cell division protein FtsW